MKSLIVASQLTPKIKEDVTLAYSKESQLTFVDLYYYYNFKYPKSLSIGDAPYTLNPEFERDGLMKFRRVSDDFPDDISESYLRAFDEIIFVTLDDPSRPQYRIIIEFAKFVSNGIHPYSPPEGIPPIYHLEYDKFSTSEYILKTFSKNRMERLEWDYSFGDIQYGLIKDYFDYNWAVNSTVLLGAILRNINPDCVENSGYPVSKYELMMFMILAKKEKFNQDFVDEVCNEWSGSGKYDGDKGIGSERARKFRFGSLINRGLITRLESNDFELSQWGHKLASKLPKDCLDPDLPFRMERWCEEDPAPIIAIDKYIKRYFEKVKKRVPDDNHFMSISWDTTLSVDINGSPPNYQHLLSKGNFDLPDQIKLACNFDVDGVILDQKTVHKLKSLLESSDEGKSKLTIKDTPYPIEGLISKKTVMDSNLEQCNFVMFSPSTQVIKGLQQKKSKISEDIVSSLNESGYLSERYRLILQSKIHWKQFDYLLYERQESKINSDDIGSIAIIFQETRKYNTKVGLAVKSPSDLLDRSTENKYRLSAILDNSKEFLFFKSSDYNVDDLRAYSLGDEEVSYLMNHQKDDEVLIIRRSLFDKREVEIAKYVI